MRPGCGCLAKGACVSGNISAVPLGPQPGRRTSRCLFITRTLFAKVDSVHSIRSSVGEIMHLPIPPADRPNEVSRFIPACSFYIESMGYTVRRRKQFSHVNFVFVGGSSATAPWFVHVVNFLHCKERVVSYR